MLFPIPQFLPGHPHRPSYPTSCLFSLSLFLSKLKEKDEISFLQSLWQKKVFSFDKNVFNNFYAKSKLISEIF